MSNPTFEQSLLSIFDFSIIRIQQILEIIQYTGLYFFLGLCMVISSEKLFQKEYAFTASLRSTSSLLLVTCSQMTFDVITIFYIHKIANLVPFLFRFTPSYINSFEKESLIGGAVALALTFSLVHPSLGARISELARRLGCDLCDQRTRWWGNEKITNKKLTN